MIQSVSLQEAIPPTVDAEKPILNDLFVRIWSAVLHVFSCAAAEITTFISYCSTTIQTLCGIGESWPQRNDREFLQNAIDSIRLAIGKKCPEALVEFNEGLESYTSEALQLAIKASIRAYMLSEDDFVPSYLDGHIEKVYDPQDYGNGRVRTITGYFEYKSEIEDLKAMFMSLDHLSQQVILDHLTADCDIGQLNLCKPGKEILKKTAEFSLKFVAGNPQFERAFRGIH